MIGKIILILLLVALISVIILTALQVLRGNICPPVLGIPACYILLFAISAAIISHLKMVNDKLFLFFSGVAIALGIAVYASFNQIYKLFECPKEPIFQTPMCFLSFFLFSVILILKLAEINRSKI